MVSKEWVVCKFGGTSVSQRSTWDVIVRHVDELRAQGQRVCIVVSAVSQVTNHLEKIVAALRDSSEGDALAEAQASKVVEEEFEWITERHKRHCAELQVDYDSVAAPFLLELSKLLEGMRLTGDGGSPRLRARVLSFGERLSSHIGVHVLSRELAKGTRVGLIDARKVLVSVTGSRRGDGGDIDGPKDPADIYLNADVTPFSLDLAAAASTPDPEEIPCSASIGSGGSGPVLDRRALLFLDKDVVITQGFIASTQEGACCVLGRGGSDTSGALFASALSAKRLEIWTDVDGMFSSDPRKVPGAKLIQELSYREAQELAAMGAKVLHPRCLGPASWANIPVEIHNTMRQPQAQMTRIMAPERLAGGGAGSRVMAITRRSDQVLLTISSLDMWGESGFLSRVFAPFDRLDISVDLIATSQYAVSMTLDYIPGGIEGEAFRILIRALQRQGTVHVDAGCDVVSIVGRKLRAELHRMADAFKELEQYNLLLLSESTEDLNMSFVLGESNESLDELVQSLHQVLLEDDPVPVTKLKAKQCSAPGPVTTPSSPGKKMRSTSFSSNSEARLGAQAVTRSALSRATMLDPRNWIENEMASYQNVPTPFCIVDLASVEQSARVIPFFPVSWSTHAAVLRVVKRANPNVVFVCRTSTQVHDLCSVIGPNINVYVPPLEAAKLQDSAASVLPPGLVLHNNLPAENEMIRTYALLADARVFICSVVEKIDAETVQLNGWFPTKGGMRINLLTDIPSDLRRAQALSLHEEVLDTLFQVSPLDNLLKQSSSEPVNWSKDQPAPRIAMTGIASLPYDTATMRPAPEYVRYSVSFSQKEGQN